MNTSAIGMPKSETRIVPEAVAVLAGFGLKFILERFKSQKTKLAVTALFCGLVLFEF